MRLLLTGAAGFLGRHVAQQADGWTVHTMDRRHGADFSRAGFARTLAGFRPDAVLHCAGAPHAPDAAACFAANTVLAANLLAAAADQDRPPRVVLIGSAAEYGLVRPRDQPVQEAHPCAPRTAYAVAKHAQTLLGQAAAQRGLRVLTARLFNPVGTGMPADLALPAFARRISAAGASGTIAVGDLTARRDFIDAAEAARLLLALAALPAWPWPVVNLCSGVAHGLGDLLDRMIALSGAAITLRADPSLMRPGDMPELVGSTARLDGVGLPPHAPDFATLLPALLADAAR